MSNKITVKITINSPIQTVWESYTNPEHITKWNFASDDWECPKATNDLQVGGKFVSTMAAKDGSFSFNFSGTYTEIKEFEIIKYLMEDGREAEILFKTIDTGTEVTTIFDPESENPIEMQQGGWQAILDNFKKHTESLN